MPIDLRVKPKARTKSLRDGIVTAFDPPRAQKLRHSPLRADVGTELTLQPRIGDCLVILVDCGSEEQVTPAVPGQQRGFTPRPTHAKIDCTREIARVQILLLERTCFPNHIARKREPIADRIAGYIKKLAKQILIHETAAQVCPAGWCIAVRASTVNFTPPSCTMGATEILKIVSNVLRF